MQFIAFFLVMIPGILDTLFDTLLSAGEQSRTGALVLVEGDASEEESAASHADAGGPAPSKPAGLFSPLPFYLFPGLVEVPFNGKA